MIAAWLSNFGNNGSSIGLHAEEVKRIGLKCTKLLNVLLCLIQAPLLSSTCEESIMTSQHTQQVDQFAMMGGGGGNSSSKPHQDSSSPVGGLSLMWHLKCAACFLSMWQSRWQHNSTTSKCLVEADTSKYMVESIKRFLVGQPSCLFSFFANAQVPALYVPMSEFFCSSKPSELLRILANTLFRAPAALRQPSSTLS